MQESSLQLGNLRPGTALHFSHLFLVVAAAMIPGGYQFQVRLRSSPVNWRRWNYGGGASLPRSRGLQILAETPANPAIPFITSTSRTPAEIAGIKSALLAMQAEPEMRETLRALRITNISPADPAAYQVLLRYQTEASALGYPDLA